MLSSIIVEDSFFYVSGLSVDTVAPFRLGSLYGKLSFEGEVLDLKIETDSSTITQLWRNTLIRNQEGDFVVTGNFTDSLSSAALLLKLNDEGYFLSRKIFRNPEYPDETFIVLLSSIKTSDNGHLLVNNVSGSSANGDVYVIKTDSSGVIEWDERYGGNVWSEGSGSILEKENGKYILGGFEHNINLASGNYKSRTYLFQIDSIGQVEWEYKSPENELQGNANDILQSPDGGYIIASSKGIEEMSGPNSFLRWWHYIYKINANREFEWGVDIRDITPSENYFTKLIAPSDGSGYVAVGTIFEDTPEPGYNINGIITKISTTGDSLWTRYYSHVDSPADIITFSMI